MTFVFESSTEAGLQTHALSRYCCSLFPERTLGDFFTARYPDPTPGGPSYARSLTGDTMATGSNMIDAANGIIWDFDHNLSETAADDVLTFVRAAAQQLELASVRKHVIDPKRASPSHVAPASNEITFRDFKIRIGFTKPTGYATEVFNAIAAPVTPHDHDTQRRNNLATRSFKTRGYQEIPPEGSRPLKRRRKNEEVTGARLCVISVTLCGDGRELGKVVFTRLSGRGIRNCPRACPMWYTCHFQPFDPVSPADSTYTPIMLFSAVGGLIPMHRPTMHWGSRGRYRQPKILPYGRFDPSKDPRSDPDHLLARMCFTLYSYEEDNQRVPRVSMYQEACIHHDSKHVQYRYGPDAEDYFTQSLTAPSVVNKPDNKHWWRRVDGNCHASVLHEAMLCLLQVVFE